MVLLSYTSPVRGRAIKRVPLSEVEAMVKEGTAVKSRALPGHLYETRLAKPKVAEPEPVEPVEPEENPADYETRVMKPRTNTRSSRTRRYRKEGQ
jgi:hypothetical protein